MSAPPSKTPKPCEVRRTNPNIMLQNTSARKPTIVARSLLPIRLTRPLSFPAKSSSRLSWYKSAGAMRRDARKKEEKGDG